jgi:hypothetical protein
MWRRIVLYTLAALLWLLALGSLLAFVRMRDNPGRLVAQAGFSLLAITLGIAAWRSGRSRQGDPPPSLDGSAHVAGHGAPVMHTKRSRSRSLVFAISLGAAALLGGAAYSGATKGSEFDEAACKEAYRFFVTDAEIGRPTSVIDRLASATDKTLQDAGKNMAHVLGLGSESGKAEFVDAVRTMFRRCKQLGLLPADLRVP